MDFLLFETYRVTTANISLDDRGKGCFPSPDYFSASFARRFFSPFFLNAEPGLKLTCSLYLAKSVFFIFLTLFRHFGDR